MKWLAVVCFVALALGIVGVSAAALATQYLFQEPAATTWSRYLEPEIACQRAKYTSAGWLFDLLLSFLDQLDPREAFIVSTLRASSPEDLSFSLIAPRSSGPLSAPAAPSTLD